ncbi:MAG: lysophospholipid acyltransferase family protein [Pseudomonadota bacterium]|nr:MAG: 1-acyl-sn-glycerol-3-phosphate acyltransferase [Pseudomonadota bacterium]
MDRSRTPSGALLVVFNALYWPYLVVTCVLFFVPAFFIFLVTFWQKPRRALHAYTSLWASHYLAWAPYAGIRVEGRERAPKGRACVYVANHQSLVDILAVYGLRLPFLWVSKIENFRVPFLGWNMYLNGYVPLRRGHLPSIRRMLRVCERALRSGSSLCVFPEGTRSKDGALKPFYRGAFWLAVRAGVPIVPIVVSGTGEILPKGQLGIRPRPVTVRVLDPISPDEAAGDDRRLRELVFERMQRELAVLRGQSLVAEPALATIPLEARVPNVGDGSAE